MSTIATHATDLPSLSSGEARRMLGWSRYRMLRAARQGFVTVQGRAIKVPSYQVNGRWYVAESAVNAIKSAAGMPMAVSRREHNRRLAAAHAEAERNGI